MRGWVCGGCGIPNCLIRIHVVCSYEEYCSACMTEASKQGWFTLLVKPRSSDSFISYRSEKRDQVGMDINTVTLQQLCSQALCMCFFVFFANVVLLYKVTSANLFSFQFFWTWADVKIYDVSEGLFQYFHLQVMEICWLDTSSATILLTVVSIETIRLVSER